MDKDKVVSQLRAIIDELVPFRDVPRMIDEDGTDHSADAATKTAIESVESWCAVLKRFSDVIESEEGPLSEGQRDEIGSNLFRGMGSFSDFQLNSRIFGIRANAADQRIRRLTSALYKNWVQ